MNIVVFGAGAFGTAVAKALSINQENKVLLFSKDRLKVDEINLKNTNKSCFPNKHLTKSLSASLDIQVILDADVIFIAYPSNIVLEQLTPLKSNFKEDVLLVNLSKGLLEGGVTLVDSMQQKLHINNVVTLKGPSFAVELMEDADTLLTLGYTTNEQLCIIQQIVKNTVLHIDSTNDIRGVEVLSVLKNIYAIFLGVVDAKYNSSNTRFMILTKAFSEVRVILKALGGSEDTLFLACGFGDLCLTSLNDLSRNRTLGLLIGKGFYNSDYERNSVILEGLNSISMIYKLVHKSHIDDLPIFSKLHSYFLGDYNALDFTFEELVNI